MATELHLRTIAVLKKVPRGKVVTYGLVAAMAGNPRAARQVVRTLNTSSEIEKLPWHRVINSQGKISLKPGQGYELQKALLEKEGVRFGSGGQVDLKKYLWSPKRSSKLTKPKAKKPREL
jgi:methylated-DNA-protein-cysteine methyltransferase-like protein